MIFLLLAGISVLLAVLQLRGRRTEDPAQIRSALLRGGTAFLAGWLVQAGTYSVARGSAGTTLIIWYSVQAALLALLSLLLWSSLASLAFYRFRRRDLLWVVPFGVLSILVGALGGATPLSAALLATPALFRVRWKREASPATVTFAGLFGFLFVLLSVVSPRLPVGEVLARLPVAQLERFSDWVRGLVAVHVLLALPRLLWGVNLPIRSVRRRLLISHLLTGVVPIALIGLFWGLSTYLSVNGERARIAARFLAQSGMDLGSALESARDLREPDREDSGRNRHDQALATWAEIEQRRHPGVRVWRGPMGGPLLRVFGDPIREEEALAFWPDSFPQQGVVLLGGEIYLGAIRRSYFGDSVGCYVALIPNSSLIDAAFQERMEAEVFIESRWLLTPLAGGRAVGVAERKGGNPQAVAPGREHRAAPGAATTPALEWRDGRWQNRMVLVWTRVGFLTAIRGLVRNLQENPFNLFPLLFLGVVAVLFVLVEVLTLGMASSMSGSILRALSSLRQGTSRLRSGNFRYRIPIEGNDELWEVGESFNDMAEDLDRARELEMEQDRIEGELALARQIQARLLPSEIPSVLSTEMAGIYLPARQVGGDYYDIIRLSQDRVALMVADVSGKGIPAALLMSSFRAALLSQNLEERGPAQVMHRLNNFLHRSVEPGRFVTAFLGVLSGPSGRLTYANAGHNPPYLLGPDGDIRELRRGGLILGLFGDSPYEQAEVELRPGELLTLFTDGVTEAANEDEEFWGEERLLSLLRSMPDAPCRKILNEIVSDVRAFSGSAGPTDDITLVLARWEGEMRMAGGSRI